ncbi:aromatic ring-hydroxylating dioxygenase subunit alpha [bacterium]|nr:aromatic ring-hydroxylating dioxygenase subunit alpha [bacterium]
MPTPPYYLWNHWYIAARSHQVKAHKPFAATLLDTRLVLYRNKAGGVVALRDRCPHLGASLSLGHVRDGCVTCPFHGWRFDEEGRCLEIPALGEAAPTLQNLRIPRYHTIEAGGLVWVYMTQVPDAVPQGDPVPPELREPGWAYGLIEDRWDTNFTRFAENMLDMVHLPYVHARTIGRFAKKRSPHVPKVTELPDGFDLEDGLLTFRLPNVHRLTISAQMIHYMWGVPVGATETRVYILGLRRFARSRLLTPLFNRYNRKVLDEDRTIIASQEPKYVTFGPGGDLLMRPDSAARAYRSLLARVLDGGPGS